MKSLRIFLPAALLLAVAAYADVSGKWSAEFDTPIGQQKYSFDLKAEGATLTGKVTSPRGTQDIQDGKVSGDEISFGETLEIQGRQIKIEYTGKISGDQLKLTRKVGDLGQSEAVAKRDK